MNKIYVRPIRNILPPYNTFIPTLYKNKIYEAELIKKDNHVDTYKINNTYYVWYEFNIVKLKPLKLRWKTLSADRLTCAYKNLHITFDKNERLFTVFFSGSILANFETNSFGKLRIYLDSVCSVCVN